MFLLSEKNYMEWPRTLHYPLLHLHIIFFFEFLFIKYLSSNFYFLLEGFSNSKAFRERCLAA